MSEQWEDALWPDLRAMTEEELRAEERRLLEGFVPGTAMAKGQPRNTVPDVDRIVACRVELDRRTEERR